MKPSIETAKKLAGFLDTSVGYLLGETEDDDLLKDQDMICRFKDIKDFSKEEKSQINFTLDALIRDARSRFAYA